MGSYVTVKMGTMILVFRNVVNVIINVAPVLIKVIIVWNVLKN